MKFEKVLTITLKSQASHSARHRRGARPVRGEVTDTAERGDDPEGTVRHGPPAASPPRRELQAEPRSQQHALES